MRWRWLAAFLLLGSLTGCDQLTKHVASAELRDAAVPLISGVLDLTYTENRDVGFSLLRAIEPDSVRRVVILTFGFGMLAMLGWMLARTREQPFSASAPLLLLGAGAIGNVADRLFRGYVVDFIHIHHWPVFNVSDCLLVAGGAWLAVQSIRARPRASPNR